MDFGTELREARERHGVSLRQIAASTKISVRALEALERNELGRLPGGIFTRAIIRSYAAEVGLDPDEVLRRYLEQYPEMGVSPDRREEDFETRRRLAGGILVVVGVALAAAITFLVVSRVMGRAEEDVPPPAAEMMATGSTGTTEPGSNPGARPDPSQPLIPPPADNPAAVPSPTQRPTEIVVTLAPTGQCWVQAAADGTQVFARLMQRGERETVRASREVSLEIGDAASCAYTLNGQAGRPLGGAGEPVSVRITPENFQTYLARPE